MTPKQIPTPITTCPVCGLNLCALGVVPCAGPEWRRDLERIMADLDAHKCHCCGELTLNTVDRLGVDGQLEPVALCGGCEGELMEGGE